MLADGERTATLLSWYALVAALTTVPLVRWTAHRPRRRALLASLVCLIASQAISAPDFAVLAGGLVLCAITHGLLWSVIAPIATRWVPPSRSGRTTTAIYVGTSLALVVGGPLTAAIVSRPTVSIGSGDPIVVKNSVGTYTKNDGAQDWQL